MSNDEKAPPAASTATLAQQPKDDGLRTPDEWAATKGIDAATFAGIRIHEKWDRDVLLRVSEKSFDEAVKAFEGIEVS